MAHFLRSTWQALRDRTRGKSGPDGQPAKGRRTYELVPGKRAGKCIINYPHEDDTRLEVFFKDFSNGKGPEALAGGRGAVVSLIVRGFEVIRFDCLGEAGHYHIVFVRPDDGAAAGTPKRLWFYDRSVEAQINRAVFEIRTNIGYYLQRNPKKQVREVQFKPEALDVMCREAHRIALELTDKP